MKQILKNAFVVIAGAVFLWGCSKVDQQTAEGPISSQTPMMTDQNLAENADYWAKDNFDLQRVGPLLERSRNAEEFERYLNDGNGIDNLDLNGDGYADYISVDEFGYDTPNQRGMTLYDRFGPDQIQEIGTILFYRDQPTYPGSRVLIRGNEQLYGDNTYYETNWLDKTIGIVSTLFGNRTQPYRSPYYYNNYPDYYQPYQVIETPVYRTRIEQLYPQPVFAYTTAPPQYVQYITIKSPYEGKRIDKIYAKLVKPTREQEEFLKANPVPPAKGRRDMADGPGFSEDAPGHLKKEAGDQRAYPDRGNPNKPEKVEGMPKPKENPAGKPDKPEKSEKADNPNKGGGDKGKGQGQGKGKGKEKP